MKELDISNERLEFIDSTEGNIFLVSHTNNELILNVWGLELFKELGFDYNVYISDYSKIKFYDVKYIYLRSNYYETKSGLWEFKKNEFGKDKVYCKEWGDKKNIDNCYECILGATLGENIGFGEIYIYTKGKVQLQYNEKAAVNIKDYVRNASKYQYKC